MPPGGSTQNGVMRLVVGLLFQPSAGVATQVEPSGLVVDEDGQHERDRGQPPHEPENNNKLKITRNRLIHLSILQRDYQQRSFRSRIIFQIVQSSTKKK